MTQTKISKRIKLGTNDSADRLFAELSGYHPDFDRHFTEFSEVYKIDNSGNAVGKFGEFSNKRSIPEIASQESIEIVVPHIQHGEETDTYRFLRYEIGDTVTVEHKESRKPVGEIDYLLLIDGMPTLVEMKMGGFVDGKTKIPWRVLNAVDQYFQPIQHPAYVLVTADSDRSPLRHHQIAMLADTGPRAVGQLLHQNKDPETTPCHRVVHADGSLAPSYAFGGEGEQLKLLQKEGIKFEKNRVNLMKFGWVVN